MTGHESDAAGQNVADAGAAIKGKALIKPKTAAEIIEQIFAITADKNQNIKPASLSKADWKAIASCQSSGNLDGLLANKVVADACKTDAELDALAQMTVAASRCGQDTVRHELLAFCVRLASSLWIQKHRESHDLYRDILQGDTGLDSDPLAFLHKVITSQYGKRIEHAPQDNGVASAATDDAISVTTIHLQQLAPRGLTRQRDNVLLIGGLWLLVQGKIDLGLAISFFANLLEERRSRNRSNRDLVLYLAEQFTQHDSLLAATLDYFKQQFYEQAAHGRRLQTSLVAIEQENSRLKAMLTERKQAHDEQVQRIVTLQADIVRLEHSLKEQQLDERAKRTHLRDDTGQVKAKALNLLSEDVLEPLKLALSALQREKPKTEIAAHHIELVVESIERDIKWFKE